MPVHLHEMDKVRFDALLDHLREVKARYLDWAVYWYSDEPHDGDFVIYDEALRPIELPAASELSSMVGDATWYLTCPFEILPNKRYGHYRLDAIERTVTQLGDALYKVVVTPLPVEAQDQIAFAFPLPNQKRFEEEMARDYYMNELVDQDRLDRFFVVLEAWEVGRVEWVIYWHEGKPQIDDYTLFDVAKVSLLPTINVVYNYWGSRDDQIRQMLELEDAPDIYSVLWRASFALSPPSGHFQITVPDRKVRKIGDARFTVRKNPWPGGERPSIRV